MAREDLDLCPIVDDDGALAGVMTERALARRYIRESREAVRSSTRRRRVGAIVERARGRADRRARTREVARPRLGAWRWTSTSLPTRDRRRATSSSSATAPTRSGSRSSSASALLVTSNGTRPADGDPRRWRASAARPSSSSPLDTYVTARMITLSAPCRALMDREPLTVAARRPASPTSPTQVKERPLPRGGGGRRRRAARSGSSRARTSSSPTPRRVLLVDHAEQAQSVPGVEQAEIVEILDHHHIGSIETTRPGARRRSTRSARPRRW